MRRSCSRRPLGMLVMTALLALAPRDARANGRFPSASQLVVDPSDPARIVLRATFGLVQSTDGGATWQWVCESSAGYGDYFDPAIAITKSGATLVGLTGGLSRSVDRACGFARADAPLSGKFVLDLAVDPSNRRRVVAAAGPPPGQTGNAVLAESLDDGATWAASAAVMPDDFAPQTLDVAPSNPQRVYASGNGAYPAFGEIVRTDDDGATWTSATFDLKGGRAPFIAAIDPANADLVYVRIQNDTGDHLLVSTNAGVTWKDVFTFAGSMLGFALSPDGTQVAVGGPSDGLFVASTADYAFTRRSALQVRCLTWTAAGLYACAAERSDGFTVGLAPDASGAFQPLAHLAAITPLACPAGTTTGDTCAAYWPPIAAQLGGASDAGSDASTPIVTVDAATDAPSAPVAPASPGGGSSSGCSSSAAPASGAWLLVAPLLAWLARRSRRRTPGSP